MFQLSKSIKYKIIVFCLLSLFISFLPAKTIVKWQAIPVNKFKSRRAVNFDTKSKIYFYRPLRFEKMSIDVTNIATVQIKALSKTKDSTLKYTVYIDGKANDHTLKLKKSDTNYYYFDLLEINLPQNSKELSIYTRNPNAYFRVFAKQVKIIKEIPKFVRLKADNYKRIVNLITDKSRSEYYVADKDNPLKYRTKYNGTIISWFRFMPLANKSKAKVEIYVNGSLRDSYSFSHKLSGRYKVNGLKVTVGKKIEIKDVKKNDLIEIKVVSRHEIINHSYLKTGK